MNGDARSVLISPVVSEKSYGLIAERRKYTFKVLRLGPQDPDPPGRRGSLRRRRDVGQHHQGAGKPKRRGVSVGTRPGWKKAIVTIAEGQSIEAFGPGV